MNDDELPWTNLGFEETRAVFDSPSQNARVWTEGWVRQALFCPNCGAKPLAQFGNNRPVADFGCATCDEEYELKSKNGRFGSKVNDGAYGTMISRLAESNNPNLILLNYNRADLSVTDGVVVPKHFFTPELIQKRRPLYSVAKRAGWVGCNILLNELPASGRIYLVRERELVPKLTVLERWRSTLFLRQQSGEAKGWLLEVMKRVEAICRSSFTIDDIYAYEGQLRTLYPRNNNIRPKIRQQLQILRDHGYLEFVGRGRYRTRPTG